MKKVILNKSQIYEGNLILVNAYYAIETFGGEELVPVHAGGFSVLMRHNAANRLYQVFESIGCKNKIAAVSGYRTVKEQKEIYETSLQDNGKSFTEKYVALPNHSEHQTGLAIDLGLKQDNIDFICPEFPYEGICNKFRKEAVKFGFVERYGREKEVITGISHEPWHFRYVGYPHSEIMNNKKLALEEYIEYVKNFTFRGKHLRFLNNGNDTEIFFVPFHNSEVVEILIPKKSNYQISGNNIDGVIVTLWGCENG